MRLLIFIAFALLAALTNASAQTEYDAVRYQKVLYSEATEAWRMLDDAPIPPVHILTDQRVEIVLAPDETGAASRIHRIRPNPITRGEISIYLLASPLNQWVLVGSISVPRDILILNPPIPATAIRLVAGSTATIDGYFHVYAYDTTRPSRITAYAWYGIPPGLGAFLNAGIEITLDPSTDFFAILFGAALAPLSTHAISLPLWQGGLVLDPAYMFPVTSRLVGPATSWPFGVPFFYDPSLAGIDLHFQAAMLNQSLTVAFWTRPLTFTS